MLVQREPELQFLKAPSVASCRSDCWKSDMSVLECCWKAINTSIEIMKDLKEVAQKENLNKDDMNSDFTNLLRLVSYYLLWPLAAAKQTLESMKSAKNGSILSESAKNAFSRIQQRSDTYMTHWNNLYHTIRAVHIKWDHEQPSPTETLATDAVYDRTVEITSLGAVELLLRLVSEATNEDSIDKIHAAFRKLNIARLPRESKGLPALAAICTTQNSARNRPCHVIATTTDNWHGFNAMSKFAKDARKSRLESHPFLEYKADIQLIKDDTVEIQQSNGRDGRVKGFDHQSITVRPLWLPNFALKARCVRCQALFHYHVEDTLAQLEKTETSINADMNCAETFAHFYCRAGFGSGKCFGVERYQLEELSEKESQLEEISKKLLATST